MKRVLITQYGKREMGCTRNFVVETEDDIDPSNMDRDRLELLADEEAISWEDEEINFSADPPNVQDEDFGVDAYKETPVLKWTAGE